jgi:hypothetical protein
VSERSMKWEANWAMSGLVNRENPAFERVTVELHLHALLTLARQQGKKIARASNAQISCLDLLSLDCNPFFVNHVPSLYTSPTERRHQKHTRPG